MAALGFWPASSTAWGAITACAAPPGNTLATYAPTALTNGCSQVDANFINVGLTTNGGPHAPGTGDIDLGASGGVISGTPSVISPILIALDSPNASTQTGNGWYLTIGDGTGTGNDQVSDTTYVFNVPVGDNGHPPVTPASFSWELTGLTLGGITSSVTNATNTIVILETFCLSHTTTASCPSADLGTITATITSGGTVFTESCGSIVGCSTVSGGVVFTHPVVEVAIDDTVTITRNVSGTTLYLTDFSNGFDQTGESPEPSTFVLLGSVLAGVALLRRRRSA